jgi:hypothetical protein
MIGEIIFNSDKFANRSDSVTDDESWLVEASMDGQKWRELDHKENNNDLNGSNFTRTFPLPGSEACRLIRLVNIGRNHQGYDALCITGWEIFGIIIE